MSRRKVTQYLLADGAVVAGKIGAGAIVNADINAAAAIAYSKLSLANSIVNADIAAAAAIAYSKLNLANSIVNADIAAAAGIAYSKLTLTNSIVNADVAAAAAIAYSKLSLTNSIVNADIASGAAIADTKLDTISTAGKVANSATTATAANTASAIVARDGSGDFTANLITLVGTPTNANHVVTKSYADALSTGQRNKEAVRAATTAALPAYTHNAGVLTASANGALAAQDGVTLTTGDRFLVKNESGASEKYNGIYTLTDAGSAGTPWVLTRATDADADAEVKPGLTVFVSEGTVNGNNSWALITDAPITVGTTALTFTQVSGAGQIDAGTALSKNGNTINHDDTAVAPGTYDLAKVTVDQQGHITAIQARAFGIYNGTATGGETTLATTANIVPNSERVVIDGVQMQKGAGDYTINNTTGDVTLTTALEAGEKWEVQVMA